MVWKKDGVVNPQIACGVLKHLADIYSHTQKRHGLNPLREASQIVKVGVRGLIRHRPVT